MFQAKWHKGCHGDCLGKRVLESHGALMPTSLPMQQAKPQQSSNLSIFRGYGGYGSGPTSSSSSVHFDKSVRVLVGLVSRESRTVVLDSDLRHR